MHEDLADIAVDPRTVRFLGKVNKNGPIPERCPELGPCWLWKPLGSVHGYGQFTFAGRVRLAHRVAHEIFIGPIPPGLTVDHLCNVRPCVNPRHLEAVTRAENLRRARTWENGASFQREKTHCPKGHPYSGDNLYLRPDGARGCRACGRRTSAEYKAKMRAENPPRSRRWRTECGKGHAYTEHGYIAKSGQRCCHECDRIKLRASRARKKAAQPPKPPKLTCKRGHPWVEENIYVNPNNGTRACRACHNARTLAAYYKKKAERPAA